MAFDFWNFKSLRLIVFAKQFLFLQSLLGTRLIDRLRAVPEIFVVDWIEYVWLVCVDYHFLEFGLQGFVDAGPGLRESRL